MLFRNSKRNTLILCAVVFVLLEAGVALLLFAEKRQEERQYYSAAVRQLETEFQSVVDFRRRFAVLVLDELVATPAVTAIMHAAWEGDEEERQGLRAKLLRLMKPLDARLRQEYFRQFQFHLPDGVSFLRLHAPKSFGDPLFDVRPSVRIANTEKRRVEGIEIGRFFLGYRFVFPLFHEDEHVGSVEVSVPFYGLRNGLEQSTRKEYFLALKSGAVDEKLFAEVRDRYEPSALGGDLVEEKADLDEALHPDHPGKIPLGTRQVMARALPEDVLARLAAEEPFALGLNRSDGFWLFSFLPIRESEGKCVAYLISITPDYTFSNLRRTHLVNFGIATALVLLALFLYWRWTRRLEERFRFQQNLLNSIPTPVFYKDMDGVYQGCNAAFSAAMGLSSEELRGRRAEDLVSPEMAWRAELLDQELLAAGGGVRQLEVPYAFPDGSRRDMLIYKSLFKDDDGRVLGIINAAIDNTEKNADARRINELNIQLQLILDSAGEGIFGLDRAGRITFMNRAGEEMLGWKGGEILGEVQHDLVHHTRRDGTAYPHEECPTTLSMGSGVRRVVEDEVYWRRDGSPFPVVYTSTPLHGADGKVAGAVVIFSDITARKKAEEEIARHQEELEELVAERTRELREKQAQLLHASRLSSMGEMATAMAHEIFQPLNVIAITVQTWELLAAKGRLRETAMLAETDKIRRNVARISKIIEHVRSFGRSVPEELAAVDVRAVVNEALSLCRVQFRNKDIALVEDLGEAGEALTLAVATEIEQVLLNLFANARDAVAARREREPGFQPRVTVRAGSKDARVFVAVEDNGGGVPAGDEERIFSSFFTTKPAGVGTGLGLSISRQIVEKFHGSLECENHAGEGACFTLWLPAHQRADEGIGEDA